MDIRKEIIRPGTYTYINPDTNKPERMTVTKNHIKHFADQGNKMLAGELSIPVPIEHQEDAVPMTKADRAAKNLMNNAGWVKKYEVKDDRLIGILDIQDEKIIEKLPKTIRFTSPHINSFTDGTGAKWDGVISHVALTTRPRITKQEPFAPDMAAALSLVTSLTEKSFSSQDVSGKGISLSCAGLLEKEGDTFKPKFPLAFSLLAGIKLSEEEIEKVKKKEKDDDEEDSEEGEEKKSPIDAVREEKNGSGVQADVKIHHVIGHLLEVLGFAPPQNMDETTFERDIYETLMAKFIEVGAKMEGDEEDTGVIDDAEDKKSKNPIVEEQPQMYASLEEINAITDHKERKQASMLFSLQQQIKKQEEDSKAQIAAVKEQAEKDKKAAELQAEKDRKRAEAVSLSILEGGKKKRDQRIERIAKMMPAAKRDKLLATVGKPSAALSLSDTGVVVDPMAESLELIETALEVGGGSTVRDMLVNGKSFSEESHPPMDGTISDERAEELVNQVLGVQKK